MLTSTLSNPSSYSLCYTFLDKWLTVHLFFLLCPSLHPARPDRGVQPWSPQSSQPVASPTLPFLEADPWLFALSTIFPWAVPNCGPHTLQIRVGTF
jgi:hypothetical protein